MSVLENALVIANLGLPVFPVVHGKKKPAITGWQKNATTKPAQIREWAKNGQLGNCGVVAGESAGVLVLDFDSYAYQKSDPRPELEKKLGPLPETFTVQTRAGGSQEYFKYPPGSRIRNSASKVAKNIDVRGEGGYVVGPGSWVDKDEKGPAGHYSITKNLPLAPLPASWVEYLQKVSSGSSEKESAPSDTSDVTHHIPSGTRNSTMLSYAGKLRKSGLPQAQIESALLGINASQCLPPLDQEEVLDVARRYEEEAPQSWNMDYSPIESEFELVRASDLHTRPIDFLVNGVMETDSLAEIHGDPESGKSLIAISLAVCIASGRPWFDIELKQGSVVYVAGEGLNGITRRLEATATAMDVDLKSLPLFVSKTASDLHNPHGAKKVEAAIEKITKESGSPKLIVIDTMARNFGAGDENSTRDMSVFIQNLDRFIRVPTKAAVLLIHHSGHSEKNRARGSSALRGALDVEYLAVKDDAGTVRFSCSKAKEFEYPTPMAFSIASMPIAGSSTPYLLRISYSAPAKTSGLGGNQKIVIDTLRAETSKASGQIELVKFKRSCLTAGITTRAFSEAFSSLCTRGLIHQSGQWVHHLPAEKWNPFGPADTED